MAHTIAGHIATCQPERLNFNESKTHTITPTIAFMAMNIPKSHLRCNNVVIVLGKKTVPLKWYEPAL